MNNLILYLILISFLFQITSLNNNNNNKILESFGLIIHSKYHIQKKLELENILKRLYENNPPFDERSIFSRIDANQGVLDYKSQYFSDNYTKGEPIYIRVFDSAVNRNQFGNAVGELMHDYACADFAGAHFIIVFRPSIPKLEPFEQNLPHIIVHQNPARNLNISIDVVKYYCGNPNQAWVSIPAPALLASRHIPRLVMNHAITMAGIAQPLFYYQSELVSPNAHEINNTFPVVADVAVHYRCSDNVRFGGMGILPFETLRDIIKESIDNPIHPTATIRYVAIHTEAFQKNHLLCKNIVTDLLKYLHEQFPSLYFVVSPQNIFGALYSFVHSKVLICSSSTFCTHGAWGNTEGLIYIPGIWYHGVNLYPNWITIQQIPRTNWPTEGIDGSLEDVTKFFLKRLRNITEYNRDIIIPKRNLRNKMYHLQK